MTPIEKIAKHRDLLNLVLEHEYIPQSRQQNFGEVVQAMQELNPNAKYNLNCQGCVIDLIRMAYAHLVEFDKQNKTSFPKHKKK